MLFFGSSQPVWSKPIARVGESVTAVNGFGPESSTGTSGPENKRQLLHSAMSAYAGHHRDFGDLLTRLRSGLFNTHRRSAGAKSVGAGSVDADDDRGTASTTTAAGPLAFETEDECVSANGGRPCLCDLVDFLELVSVTATTAGDATVSRCRSYRAAPAAFVVGRSAADNNDHRSEEVTVPVRLLVFVLLKKTRVGFRIYR